MGRRIGKEDIESVNPFAAEGEPFAPSYWRVYRDYEVVSVEDDPGWAYVEAVVPAGHREPEVVKVYNPFTDAPRLFVDFARIAESKDPDQALDHWFGKYGLLGMTPRNPRYSGGAGPAENPALVQGLPLPRYDDRGGPADDFRYISLLAYEANEALTLYEAVLNRDAEKLEGTIFGEKGNEGLRKKLEAKADRTGAGRIDVLAQAALMQLAEYVSSPLQVYAYPTIAYPTPAATAGGAVAAFENTAPWAEDKLGRGWGARNLAGAMYLQFYWLVTSAGELSRCLQCGRIISYAPPFPGAGEPQGRKTRSDKKFCDRQCRQNHHYQKNRDNRASNPS